MKAFFIRRWWLVQSRLVSALGFAVLYPSVLFIAIVFGMKNIVVRTINGLPYEVWVAPGVMMLVSAISITPILYRDFFDLRIHGKSLEPIILSPLRKPIIILGIIVSALSEVLLIIMVFFQLIYLLIFPNSITFFQAVINFFYAIIFALLYGNLIITLSLVTERITTFLTSILTILILIIFSCGILVEFEFFPQNMGSVLEMIPFSMLMIANRAAVFIHQFDTWRTFFPLLIVFVWVLFNSELLKRKFKH